MYRAADRSCLEAWEADIKMFLGVPGITSKEQLPRELRNFTLALITDRFPCNVWTHIYTNGSAEEGMRNGGSNVYIKYQDGDIMSLSVPGGLQCSNYRAEIPVGYLYSCRAPVREQETNGKYCHLHWLPINPSTQALNSANTDQMIQGLHSSLAKLTAQFSVFLQWVPAHVGQETKQQTDLQKLAVRLCRHRTLSPTERPRHFSTLGTMETGRKKTVDTRHTLTQSGDWSGSSRPLSSACAQGTVVRVPIWRGLAFDTSLDVNADKLTKPQIKARRQGFSPGTPVSSPPSSV